MRKFLKGAIAFSLSVAVSFSTLGAVMPVMAAEYDMTTEQDMAEPEVRSINLGMNGIGDPAKPNSPSDLWAKGDGSYVYFGECVQYANSDSEKYPIKWKVLDAEHDSNKDGVSDSTFLQSDELLEILSFKENNSSNQWGNSDLRKWLNSQSGWSGNAFEEGFLNHSFNSVLQNAICNTYITETEPFIYTSPHNISCDPCSINGDKIFVLSIREASNPEYGFCPSTCKVTNDTISVGQTDYVHNKANGNVYRHWLRSPITGFPTLVNVVWSHSNYSYDNYYVNGKLVSSGAFYGESQIGVVPALNLDNGAVLFNRAEDAVMKSFGEVNAVGVNDVWALTILDGTDFDAALSANQNANIRPGQTISVDITNIPMLTSGNAYTQISAMMVDENNTVVAYGKVSDNVSCGTVWVDIPAIMGEGKYSLMLFAEDYNGGVNSGATSYASNMVKVADVENKVYDFVERMYTVALDRPSDVNGKVNWVTMLMAGSHDGAGLAREFILGKEFAMRNLSDEQYVDVLYKTFFDREADEGGKNLWMAELAVGKSREYVLSKFVNLQEFTMLCQGYDIERGVMLEDGTPVNPGIPQFVKRLYLNALGRDADNDGLYNYTVTLLFKVQTAENVAKSFFASSEYQSKNKSDEEYVRDLYVVFMNREPDEGGLYNWVNVLNAGMSREDLLSQFATSQEFKAITAILGL